MTATEVFESVTGSGSSDFARLVRILNQHGPWCLIGGLAVNCYVEPVYTLDADIVIVSRELERIKPELSAADFAGISAFAVRDRAGQRAANSIQPRSALSRVPDTNGIEGGSRRASAGRIPPQPCARKNLGVERPGTPADETKKGRA